eukprot:1610149-Rhodomonas_salina.3
MARSRRCRAVIVWSERDEWEDVAEDRDDESLRVVVTGLALVSFMMMIAVYESRFPSRGVEASVLRHDHVPHFISSCEYATDSTKAREVPTRNEVLQWSQSRPCGRERERKYR